MRFSLYSFILLFLIKVLQGVIVIRFNVFEDFM